MKIVKKFNYIIFVLTLFISFVVPVNALSQTTIKTSIPDTHTTNIVIKGEGTITINGTVYHQGDQVSLKRGQKYQFVFNASSGYKINKVMLNGEDVTEQLMGNILETTIYQDGQLDIEYSLINKVVKTDVNLKNKTQNVSTGDQQSMLIYYMLCMLSIVCMLSIIKKIDVLK